MKHTHLALLLLAVSLFSLQGCAGKSSQQARLQSMDNSICQDTVSGRMWQIEKGPMAFSLAEAEQYVRSLNLGGYNDWRLPTVSELYDLNYYFDLFLVGDCTLDRKGSYWSSEKDGAGKAGAWEIGASQCDPSREYTPSAMGYVRAVRP
ncbi:Lcl C-terminal domain-containing protein [Thiovibrio frasassiensis]|uniref:DUF1566 domain-containing protein n=1 Tax=Thiovibrio frasassiensis TaxID=2984131 RepID=A0A9X4MFQ3_9BACT|nr:DUF1566 domain-containing protein [Thiovibrio frasassiensis]MDG4474673.1 DUF1566 domain-containing protein [Thiovibrio frasassiensis]